MSSEKIQYVMLQSCTNTCERGIGKAEHTAVQAILCGHHSEMLTCRHFAHGNCEKRFFFGLHFQFTWPSNLPMLNLGRKLWQNVSFSTKKGGDQNSKLRKDSADLSLEASL